MSIDSVMPSNQLILLPSVFPSIRVFSNKSTLCIRWSKYWSFNFSTSPFNFRIDWFDLLAVQGILKSYIQHSSLKASILWCSAFFIVQWVLQNLLFSCPTTPHPDPTPGSVRQPGPLRTEPLGHSWDQKLADRRILKTVCLWRFIILQ